MPRPGPRPYECIRRAWHSDSHQPLRGALIQEIFRVVNELHSTSTRRKKEWQEKLPIVVLRAEEILYSKANSESEYAGVETLRTRLDDAVNTMIRREETEEEGIYLPPCVEAALSLGCTPKKVPRGQRQVAARLAADSARRNLSANAVNGGYKAMTGNGSTEVRSAHAHERNTSFSSCLVDTHMQDKDSARITATNLYSSVGIPLTPDLCQTNLFPPTFTASTSFDAACPFMTSFPQLGSLVQFLKGGDNTSMLPESLHANHNFRARQHDGTSDYIGDTEYACGNFANRASVSKTNTEIVSQMSLPSSDTKMMQQKALAPRNYSGEKHMDSNMVCLATSPTPWYTSLISTHMPSHLSTNLHTTSISSPGGEASVQACFTDLQLRLGPPGEESSSTSAIMSSGASATKRLRVDNGKLNGSANADQFQL